MLTPKILRTHRLVLVSSLVAVAAAEAAFPESIAERTAAAVFEKAKTDPLQLYRFLLHMPKGADLHNHVSGAVYAETYISEAATDGLCIDTRKLSLVTPAANRTCDEGLLNAREALLDNDLDSRLIDSLSMRDFVPGAESGHDHFFAAFDKFGPASHGHEAEGLAEVVQRAADQNESYLELMALTAGGAVSELGEKVKLQQDDLAVTEQALFAAGLKDDVQKLRAHVDELERSRLHLLQCDTKPDVPACHVTVRYVLQVMRNSPKAHVFAQMLAGFLLVQQDPRVVAVNPVQPEDYPTSLRDYGLHMKMLGFLHAQYPNVHLTLHAGELAPGLVPPEGLQSHIEQAVDIGDAERIGHGVDIAYEANAAKTLATMARKHIDVEINLTSNAEILGVSGAQHPFPLYRRLGVPVTLSTDDEGVARTQLTFEFRRAVETYHLTYGDVKTLVRNSLEYAFLPGGSYWADATYQKPVPACTHQAAKSCQDLLAHSEKAGLQWDLELRFAAFEKKSGALSR